jgi:hypothetical protein
MSGLPNVQQNNEQILNDIQSLQQMEQQLFNSLETNPNMTTEQQQTIVEKMNELSNMRVNLYQTLSGVNNYFENAVNTSVGSLKQQAIAIGIVESELNKAKRRLEILEEEKNNKIRLVEINTYYSDKYAEHSQMMKIIIFTLIPIIILGFLNNKGILPNMVFNILLTIIAFIGAYFFWKRFASIITRDNMNYQEYNWYFDANSAPTGSSTTSDPWATSSNYGTCVGDACCSSGMIYDSSSNQCVPETSSTSSTTTVTATTTAPTTSSTTSNTSESFINRTLTKMQPANYKIQYDLRQPEAFNTQH